MTRQQSLRRTRRLTQMTDKMWMDIRRGKTRHRCPFLSRPKERKTMYIVVYEKQKLEQQDSRFVLFET